MMMLRLALPESELINLYHRLYIRGNALLAKHQDALAQKDYQKILSLRAAGVPVDLNILADVLHNLGMIAEEHQETETAIQYYSQAVEEDETHCMTWLFLAKLYLERYVKDQHQYDYNHGIEALYRAEKMTNNFPAVRFLKQKYAIA